MILNTALDTTSIAVVGLFLLVTLLLGLYAGRNVKDFEDYALGGRRFSTFSLVLTLLATKIGGGTIFGFTDSIFKTGILVGIVSMIITLRYILGSILFARNLVKFKNCFTIGDVLEKFYGKTMKFISGICLFFSSLSMILLQLSILGFTTKTFLHLHPSYGIIIGGLILIIYSALGGIKSVVFTDVFHFLILFIVFPLIAIICVFKVGGIKSLFMNTPSKYYKIFTHQSFYDYLSYLCLFGIIPDFIADPPVMQRLLMVKNSKQIKNQLITTAFLEFIFKLIITIIGLSSILLLSNNLKIDSAFTEIVFNFLPNKIRILVILGIFSVIITTLDSRLLALGILFSEDIIKPIFQKKIPSHYQFKSIFFAKISILILGLLSIILALLPYDFNFMKMIFWSSIVSSPIVPPLLIGLMNIKSDKKSLYFGIVIGIFSFAFLNFYLPQNMQKLSIPFSMIVNFAFHIVLHLIQNRGIAIINRDYHEERPQKIWKPTWQGFVRTLASIIPTPHKIFEASRKSVVRCGANNMLFGIFVCINFIVPYFMWDHANEDLYNLMIYLRFFGGLLGGLLIVKSEWKDFLKPYFPLFWHFSLLYCLPFISTVMFLLTKGSIIWLMNIGTSIFFLIMLTENVVFLTFTPIGVATGILFYILRVGPIEFSSFSFEITYQLIYQLVFSSIIGLLFSYRKTIFNTIKGHEGTNLGLALCHELRNTGLYVYPAAQVSLMYLKKYSNNSEQKNGKNVYCLDEQHFEYIKEQNEEIERLGKLQVNIVGAFEKLLKEYRDSINDPQNFSMKFLINQTLKRYIFKQGQKEKLEINLENDFVAKVPKRVFVFVIDNIIRNAYKHGTPTKIRVWLENNELHIKDNGTGIKESEMEKIFKMHFTTGSGSSSGIGLAFAKQIIEGFGGEIWVESEIGEKSYTEFIIKFPKISENLSEEEIRESIENKTKMKIARSMRDNKADEEFIKKTTGYSLNDLEE